ncbi:MAG: hypothetical protein IKG67_11455 [Parasporobacterium sp.]|nr:hypothetical protein [Parasporobacterium sp.]
MKKIMSIIAILCMAAMMLSLTACGEKKAPAPAETTAAAVESTEAVEETTEAPAETVEETTEAPAETVEETTEAPAETAAETEAAAAADGLTPSITIEYGDYDGIVDLAKKAQNFEVEEGTVVQISGILSTSGSNPSVMEQGESDKKGITMYLDGDWEKAADGADIDVIGTFVKGQFFMELHVDPANITVK